MAQHRETSNTAFISIHQIGQRLDAEPEKAVGNEIHQLHTAIRRYCIDRHDYWTQKYGELRSRGKDRSGYEYTSDALRIFPRYSVLKAILVEVERHRPDEFVSLNEARQSLRKAVATAKSIFTQPPNGPLEREAMNEEREALDRFIADQNADELAAVEPLFYRRVLTANESSDIRQKLREIWGVADYWYPLDESKREDVEAFQDTYFAKEVGEEKLRTILRAHNVETFWELREDDINYESELSILWPFYNLNEGYWCDASFSWLIYASHESSITIGGWLLEEVRSVWPNWKNRVWTTPFFD